MEPLTPVYTVDLFLPLHGELMALLRRLSAGDWERPTVAGAWRVRDVVGHLLDVDLRNLSGSRDGYRSPAFTLGPAPTFDDVVSLINTMNASGVSFAGRLSPRLLTDLLEVTGRWIAEHVASLPPHEMARIPVAWADEDRSTHWMNIGREYTERWHHQMQIREAVGASGDATALLRRRWLAPLLDLSVRAFRRTYKTVSATVGTAIVFEVEHVDDADGEGCYVWSITREPAGWDVVRGRAPNATASVRTDADTAWKLLYNALSPVSGRARVTIEGDAALAEPICGARSVMV